MPNNPSFSNSANLLRLAQLAEQALRNLHHLPCQQWRRLGVAAFEDARQGAQGRQGWHAAPVT